MQQIVTNYVANYITNYGIDCNYYVTDFVNY